MKHIRTLLCLAMVFCFFGSTIEAKEKKYKNGDFYSGDWKKGKPEGMGKMVFANGSIYQGLWHEGKIAGEGSYKEASIEFDGTFTPIYENEELIKFKPIKGTLNTPDVKMTGEWDDHNVFQGTLTTKDFAFKGIYDSDGKVFKEGRIDGKDGSFIEGSMLLSPQFEGKMEKFVLQNSSVVDVPAIYTGKFVNGKFLGKIAGPQLSNSINEFEIEVKEDGTQYGSLTQKNGGRYNGHIKNKKYDGDGALELKDGSFSGTWSNGILTNGIIKQKGSNGKTYDFSVNGGKTTYNFPNGKTIGIYTTPDGNGSLSSELEKYIEENFEITVKEPNTILSYINPDKLDKIRYLTITGFLYDTDIRILNRCTNLRMVDLRRAIITISPETRKKRQDDAEFASALMGALADMSEVKYNAGETKSETVMYAKMLSNLVDLDLKNVNQGIDDCGIPAGAFAGLQYLKSVKLPLTATYIESWAFSNCPALTDADLPPYLKRIGIGAFDKTGLTKVLLPSTVNALGDYRNNRCAFGNNKNLELLDAGDCVFSNKSWGQIVWETPLYDCKKLVLPKNIQKIKYLELRPGSELYCPPTLEEFNQGKSFHDLIIYVQTKQAIPGYLYDCTIYVPEGGMTSWYAKYGGRNKITEGTKMRPQ